MFKYYVGYYNNGTNNEFTAICGCAERYAAEFILEGYTKANPDVPYRILRIDKMMDIKVRF